MPDREDDGLPCPCCGFLSLGEKGGWEVCPVCFWEDDLYQSENPSYAGGANEMSLDQARESFLLVGAVSRGYLKHVRAPRPDEIPKDSG